MASLARFDQPTKQERARREASVRRAETGHRSQPPLFFSLLLARSSSAPLLLSTRPIFAKNTRDGAPHEKPALAAKQGQSGGGESV